MIDRLYVFIIRCYVPMNDSKTKITASYKKISHFILYYLIFFVALILAFFVFQKVISHASTITVFQENDNLLMQKTKLIAEFNKFLKQSIKDNDTHIYILQWDLQTEAWFIKSINNLIDYKWFVVPRYFYIYSTLPVKSIAYFSGWTYDPSELENFVNTFVFTKKITVGKPFARIQLPVVETLIDDFNISCIFEGKLAKRTCDYYLNDFLDNFFVYNISLDYPGLEKIFAAIRDDQNANEAFCSWLSKYLLYTNDYSDTIERLFALCGQSYEDLFKRTTLFMEIQRNLENQAFEKISYKDNLLNAYKLLSYQQQIYQDFLINKTDIYKISSYLDFVKELLKKQNIDPFYLDEIYRYNNKYLALTLEKIAYQSSTFTQNIWTSRITSLLTTIALLNDGEPVLGIPWLVSQIQNKTLIAAENTSITGLHTSITLSEQIEKKIKNISYLSLEKYTISDTTIDIIGYLKFASLDNNETIKTHIVMEYTDDVLLIKNIQLQNKAEMNEVVKNLLLIQNFSLGELYSYISKNLIFYEQENSAITASTDLCPELEKLKNITLVSCNATLVHIEKNGIRYEFALKNGGLENTTLSDKTRENAIKASYSTIVGNSYTLITTIQSLLNYTLPTQAHEGTTNAILVFERIQHYLGVKTNDIADKDSKILVDLSLGDINFIVNYNLKTNTLGPWYFKDILVADKPYAIQNLNLPLDDAHQNTINSFVIDPLTAIKTADITAWQNYQERLKKTTNN